MSQNNMQHQQQQNNMMISDKIYQNNNKKEEQQQDQVKASRNKKRQSTIHQNSTNEGYTKQLNQIQSGTVVRNSTSISTKTSQFGTQQQKQSDTISHLRDGGAESSTLQMQQQQQAIVIDKDSALVFQTKSERADISSERKHNEEKIVSLQQSQSSSLVILDNQHQLSSMTIVEASVKSNDSTKVGIKVTHDHINPLNSGIVSSSSSTATKHQKEMMTNKVKRIKKSQTLIQSKIISTSIQAITQKPLLNMINKTKDSSNISSLNTDNSIKINAQKTTQNQAKEVTVSQSTVKMMKNTKNMPTSTKRLISLQSERISSSDAKQAGLSNRNASKDYGNINKQLLKQVQQQYHQESNNQKTVASGMVISSSNTQLENEQEKIQGPQQSLIATNYNDTIIEVADTQQSHHQSSFDGRVLSNTKQRKNDHNKYSGSAVFQSPIKPSQNIQSSLQTTTSQIIARKDSTQPKKIVVQNKQQIQEHEYLTNLKETMTTQNDQISSDHEQAPQDSSTTLIKAALKPLILQKTVVQAGVGIGNKLEGATTTLSNNVSGSLEVLDQQQKQILIMNGAVAGNSVSNH